MTRVFMTLNETNPLKPVPELHVNGLLLVLDEREFLNLLNDAHWVKSHMDAARTANFCRMAVKYEEVQQCVE